MKTHLLKLVRNNFLPLAAAAACLGSSITFVRADGSETLGLPAGVTLATGSGLAVGGVGLSDTNAGVIDVVLPTNATVQQVLLYWQGASDMSGGDADVLVGTNAVTGALIGGPTQIFPGVFESAYRADITGLDLVGAGSNTIEIAGVEFSGFNNGAGVIVIYSNAAPATLGLVDGDDFALEAYLSPLDRTQPQAFRIAASKSPRTALLALLAGGSDGLSTVRISIGGRQINVSNVLASTSGPAWDSLLLPVVVPARATNLVVEILSGDGSELAGQSSLISWVAAALAVPPAASSGSNRPPRVVLLPTVRTVRTYCPATNGTASARVRGLVNDPDCDTLTVEWFVNEASVETDTVPIPSPRPKPIDLVYEFSPGTNCIYAKVSDGTNTVFSRTNKVTVILDTEPPVVTCPGPKVKKANPHGVAHVPSFDVRARDNCTPRHRLVKTQEPHPGTALPVGTNQVTITVTDLAGNVATCETQFIVQPRQPPRPPKPPKPSKPSKSKKVKDQDDD